MIAITYVISRSSRYLHTVYSLALIHFWLRPTRRLVETSTAPYSRHSKDL
jgi:hypothetical protein